MAAGTASKVLSAIAVGPHQRVVTVEVGPEHSRTVLVLGVTAQQVSCLHVLSPSAGVPRAPEADFASEMQIMYELEKAVAGNEHPICLGIKDCIAKKLPVEIILSNIRGMATTNFNAIADHIGISLTEKIMKS